MKPIVVFTASLSTFFILFSSEGRKCDFFVRHNGHKPLVFEMNDLVIHTYQFIRLYVLLTCFSNQTDLPVVDEPFVLYCLRVLGTRDNRGRHVANVGLLERLETFYNVEYQPLLHPV